MIHLFHGSVQTPGEVENRPTMGRGPARPRKETKLCSISETYAHSDLPHFPTYKRSLTRTRAAPRLCAAKTWCGRKPQCLRRRSAATVDQKPNATDAPSRWPDSNRKE